MRLFITCDSYWEAKIDKVIDQIEDSGYESYFEEQDYGASLEGITLVLICQNPNLNLKQRIRLSKKEKKLYADIMLDLNHFLTIDQSERTRIVVDKITSELPAILDKYKLADFDLVRFKADLNLWMSKVKAA